MHIEPQSLETTDTNQSPNVTSSMSDNSTQGNNNEIISQLDSDNFYDEVPVNKDHPAEQQATKASTPEQKDPTISKTQVFNILSDTLGIPID